MDTSSPKQNASWQYDEFKQVGKDYGSPEEVDAYDASHAQFRDIEKENNEILDQLGVGENDVLIEFGTGTGNFALQAARRVARVEAVDVSETMLEKAREKASRAGIANVNFRHAGFLTYECPDSTAEFIVTSLALHHLPDFWKGIALSRLHRTLKPGGKLFLVDVILEQEEALENIQAMIDHQAAMGGDFLREDAEGHFREEFSTYDWVMDGLLERAGFKIENKEIREGVLGIYLCAKPL